MASIVINGDTSGSVTLQAPSAAGATVLTLPSTSGTIALTSGSTFTSLTTSGNLTFTSTGNRITGDFSNATIANRVIFQTSTTNNSTNVYTIPNGTSTTATYSLSNNSDPTNSSIAQIGITSTDARVISTLSGTGTYLPMTFQVGGSERMRITSNGGVSFGSSGTAYGTSGQVLQSNGDAPPSWATAAAGGFSNIDVITATGPSTWTSPPTTTKIKVTVVGGGGGTAGSPTNQGAAGGGGAAIKIFSVASATGYAYTVGAGGPSGGSGGTSSFGPVGGVTVTATGGSTGSPGPTSSFANGGVGGTGSNGDINFTGQTGGASKAPNVFVGQGGNSIFGGGGGNAPASTAATTYGGGSAGGAGSVSSSTGFQGVIIVEY